MSLQPICLVFIIRIHMCIWNSLEDLFCYKQIIQVRVNDIQLYPIDVIWIERLRDMIHLAYHTFLYAYNFFFISSWFFLKNHLCHILWFQNSYQNFLNLILYFKMCLFYFDIIGCDHLLLHRWHTLYWARKEFLKAINYWLAIEFEMKDVEDYH